MQGTTIQKILSVPQGGTAPLVRW